MKDPNEREVISDGPHEPHRPSFDSEVVGLAECIRQIANLRLEVAALEKRVKKLEENDD